jgi:hypothetical protein
MAEVEEEIRQMEYAEKVIFDIQNIFTSKLGGGYGTLKKAMDIEDYLYKDALNQIGETSNNIWESIEALRVYKSSVDRVLKLMNERSDKDTDWVKLFNIKDVKSFCQQLSRAVHTQVKRKAPPVDTSHYTIPAPSGVATNSTGNTKHSKASTTKSTGKKQHKTKKAKILEEDNRKKQFQQEWEASFNAVDSTSTIPAPTSVATATSSVARTNNNHSRTTSPPARKVKEERNKPKQEKHHKRKHEETKAESIPMITELMHQSESITDTTMGMMSSFPDQEDGDSLFLDAADDDAQGEDSSFATATLGNASDWGSTATSGQGTDGLGADSSRPLSSSSTSTSTSGWSAAIHERKSHMEQVEAKQKNQSLKQDERRRAHEEVYKTVSSKKEEEVAAAAAASEEEELRVAREREREKRERESQSQDIFMDGDHEALGNEYW